MTDVCVVGLGKIGLPLACAIARAGHRVRGADISPTVVGQVNAGDEPFPGEAGLAAALRDVVGSGALTATTDTASAVAQSTVVVIVVPLVVDEHAKPDFRAMDSATAAVGDAIGPGTLVSYETTLPVGTTRTRFANALAERSGLRVGQDLFVVHSPERVFSGRIFEDLRRYPKLVGGVDGESTRRGVAFYESFLEFDDRPDLARPNGVWDLGTAEAAELAKLAETTYRDVNIALANEFAKFADEHGIDVLQSIDAANSQPFSHIHRPGAGVGGHCIPVYPYFYANRTSEARLARLSRDVNDSMADHLIARLGEALQGLSGKRVAIFGWAYRENVKEDAFTVSARLHEGLRDAGAIVIVNDPVYTDDELRGRGLVPYDPASGDPVDAVIVQAAHSEYRSQDWGAVSGLRVLLDGRNALDVSRVPSGVQYLGIGRGARADVPVPTR